MYCFDEIILTALCSSCIADKIYSKMGEGINLWTFYELLGFHRIQCCTHVLIQIFPKFSL